MNNFTTPRAITRDDKFLDFDCGEPTLNEYLQKRALTNHIGGAATCFVTTRNGKVVGYYALSSGSVSHNNVSGRVRRNMPDPIPVVILARLAIDVSAQGEGLGRGLLLDAISRCIAAAEIVGVRAILVHAFDDDARQFYLHHDFESSPIDPLVQILLLKDAKAVLRNSAEGTDNGPRGQDE